MSSMGDLHLETSRYKLPVLFDLERAALQWYFGINAPLVLPLWASFNGGQVICPKWDIVRIAQSGGGGDSAQKWGLTELQAGPGRWPTMACRSWSSTKPLQSAHRMHFVLMKISAAPSRSHSGIPL